MTCSIAAPDTARTHCARRSRLASRALSTQRISVRHGRVRPSTATPNTKLHTPRRRWFYDGAVSMRLPTCHTPLAPCVTNRTRPHLATGTRLGHWALPRSPWHPSDAAHLWGMGAVVSTCMQGRAPIGRGTPPCFGSRSRASCVVPPCASSRKVYPSRSCKRSLRRSGWYVWQRGWRASGPGRRAPCSPLGASETRGASCTVSDPGGHSPSRRHPHATRAPLLEGST